MQREPQTTVYNIPLAMELEGDLDKDKIETVFRQLIVRHESLRTYFRTVDQEPVQAIREPGQVQAAFQVEYIESQSLPKGMDPSTYIAEQFIRPFDMSLAPMLRVSLLRTGPNVHILMIDMHHIMMDGTSQGILINEFVNYYRGRGNTLPALRVQHKDFTQWSDPAVVRRKQQAGVYWREAFKDGCPVLQLPYDFPKSAELDFSGNHLDFILGPGYLQGLKQFAGQQGATLFMVLQSLFTLLLSKISGQEDIVVGTPTTGRKHVDLQDIVGLFIKSMGLRSKPRAQKTYLQYLEEVKKGTAAAFENQEYPVEDLLQYVNQQHVNQQTGRELGHIYTTMFALQNMDLPDLELPGLISRAVPIETGTAKYEIILVCAEAGDSLECIIEYRSRLFKKETILKYISYFKHITSAALADPGQRLEEIINQCQ